MSCAPGRDVGGQPSATLTCKDGGLDGVVLNLKIKVTTPDETPQSRAWFVEGKIADTGAQVGWGEDAEGFEIKQMEETSVLYAGMPLIDTQMAFRFVTREKMDMGSRI